MPTWTHSRVLTAMPAAASFQLLTPRALLINAGQLTRAARLPDDASAASEITAVCA